MMRAILIGAACLGGLSACGTYTPTPEDRLHIVDSPADVRACRRLAEVSGPVPTSPGFEDRLDVMIQQTIALGGTDLFLSRTSGRDWSYVRGYAYRCPFERRPPRVVIPVVRAKG